MDRQSDMQSATATAEIEAGKKKPVQPAV